MSCSSPKTVLGDLCPKWLNIYGLSAFPAEKYAPNTWDFFLVDPMTIPKWGVFFSQSMRYLSSDVTSRVQVDWGFDFGDFGSELFVWFFILKEISNVFMIIEAFLFIKKTRCGVEEVGSILNSCLVRSVCWEARSRRGKMWRGQEWPSPCFWNWRFFWVLKGCSELWDQKVADFFSDQTCAGGFFFKHLAALQHGWTIARRVAERFKCVRFWTQRMRIWKLSKYA